jgi:hypothetical protein
MEPHDQRKKILKWILVPMGVGVLLWLAYVQGLPEKDTSLDAGALPTLEGNGHAAVAPLPQLNSFGMPEEASAGDDEVAVTAPDPASLSPPYRAAASIDVRLELPAAWIEHGGIVYALPAGAPGTSDRLRLPHVEVKTDRCTLHLPAAGLWDIGFASAIGSVLEEDVEIPGSSVVRLRAQDAPLRIRVEGPRPQDAEGVHLTVREVDSGIVLSYPGRGQSGGHCVAFTLDASGEGATARIGTGKPYRVEVALPSDRWNGPLEWVPDRTLAQAGDEVVLRRVERGRLQLTLSLAKPMPVGWRDAFQSGLPIMTTALSAAASVRPLKAAEPVHPFPTTYLEEDGTFMTDSTHLMLLPGTYELVGGLGTAFRDQTQSVEIVAGQTTHVAMALVPEPTFLPWRAADQPPEGGFQVQLAFEGAAPGEAQLYVSTQTGGNAELEHHICRIGADPCEVSSTNEPGMTQALQPPYGVSRPFALQARGAQQVKLERGGLLVVVPDVKPAQHVGALVLRRRDGALIPYTAITHDGTYAADSLTLTASVWVTPALRIGPLLPGRHTFDVFLGGVRIGTAAAVVQAERSTTLVVPVSGAGARR